MNNEQLILRQSVLYKMFIRDDYAQAQGMSFKEWKDINEYW